MVIDVEDVASLPTMTATIPLVGFLDGAFYTFIRFERHGFPQPRHGWDQQVQNTPLLTTLSSSSSSQGYHGRVGCDNKR